MKSEFPNISKSQALLKRSEGLIPSHTQTLAKGPSQHTRGVAPVYVERGKGSHVWDVDGNEFLDLTMAVGPVSLGYCYEPVDRAIKAQLEKGISFSLMHPLEVEVSELIRETVPNAESVRFSKTGADVTTAAIRLARAYTKRPRVLCCGYHGWHDWYIGVTDRNQGIPKASLELTHTFNYNDIQTLKDALDSDVAAVIMEPVVFEEPNDDFLFKVKELCQKNGSLLIFDEIWTGFRIAPGGAQQFFDVKSDLVTLSKAMANGMPISVLAGRAEIMKELEENVFFYTTFGGEALSLAATQATIREIQSKDVCGHLARQGKKLREGYNAIAKECGASFTNCIGLDYRTMVTFNGAMLPQNTNPLEVKALMQQEMIKRGVLWGGFHQLSFSHSDKDVELALLAYREVVPLVKSAIDEKKVRESLKGEPLAPVFRKTSHFHTKPKGK